VKEGIIVKSLSFSLSTYIRVERDKKKFF